MCRRDLAIVLVSGGMDSCVTASMAALDHALAFLHVTYGQRTGRREERAYEDLCAFFKPSHRLAVDVSHLERIGGSALTDRSIDIPVDGATSGVPVTYVPFRNAHLLATAVSWAEVIGACKVFIGVVEEDGSGYPDCRESFIEAFQRAVDEGTKPGTKVRITTPLIHKSKAEIVKIGLHLGSPLGLTWSCYRDEDEACGVCDSCRLRLRGFDGAGAEDPIPYRRHPEE